MHTTKTLDHRPQFCTCRTCRQVYLTVEANSCIRGYCSMHCQNEKATYLGWRKETAFQKGSTQYNILTKANEIGDIEAPPYLIPKSQEDINQMRKMLPHIFGVGAEQELFAST